MIFTFLMLMNAPTSCPTYCVEFTLNKVISCAEEAHKKHPKDKAAQQKVFGECLEKMKKDPIYQRCAKVCKQERT